MSASPGRGSRNKGAAGEREAARIITAELPEYPCERGARNGVRGADDAIGLPGIHLEVKRQERIEIEKWSQQSEGDAKDGDIPAVIWRRSHQPWRVSMPLLDFLRLYRKAMR